MDVRDIEPKGSSRSWPARLARVPGRAAGLRTYASALALLLFAGAAQLFGNGLIAARFPLRPRPADLLFEALPQVDVMRYGSDIAVFAALSLLLAYAIGRRRTEIPGMIAVFGIFYALRVVLMVLTPLAIAHGDGQYLALLPITQLGNFPSGHAGATLLCFLLVDAGATRLRRVMLGLAALEWASLLLSRSHYSIDVVGGLLLAYFVWREWTSAHAFDAWRDLTGA